MGISRRELIGGSLAGLSVLAGCAGIFDSETVDQGDLLFVNNHEFPHVVFVEALESPLGGPSTENKFTMSTELTAGENAQYRGFFESPGKYTLRVWTSTGAETNVDWNYQEIDAVEIIVNSVGGLEWRVIDV